MVGVLDPAALAVDVHSDLPELRSWLDDYLGRLCCRTRRANHTPARGLGRVVVVIQHPQEEPTPRVRAADQAVPKVTLGDGVLRTGRAQPQVTPRLRAVQRYES